MALLSLDAFVTCYSGIKDYGFDSLGQHCFLLVSRCGSENTDRKRPEVVSQIKFGSTAIGFEWMRTERR